MIFIVSSLNLPSNFKLLAFDPSLELFFITTIILPSIKNSFKSNLKIYRSKLSSHIYIKSYIYKIIYILILVLNQIHIFQSYLYWLQSCAMAKAAPFTS